MVWSIDFQQLLNIPFWYLTLEFQIEDTAKKEHKNYFYLKFSGL